jgi:adenosine deaminase
MTTQHVENTSVAEFAAAMPKISLHMHLEGSVEPNTVVALAAKHGIEVPGGRTVDNLYDIDAHVDLDEFLRVYNMVGDVVRDAADFHRITYETLALAASHRVLYREMFISPPAHPGVAFATMIDGIVAGVRDAEIDHGIGCRLIVAINREAPAADGLELVKTVLGHRHPEIIGIGLDYAEVHGPPERFVEAYTLAGQAGLHRTAHSETGPARNIETLLDKLGCTRIDHGYHVVRDPGLLERCRDEQITFTCTPISSDVGRYSGDGSGSHDLIAAMVDAGLRVSIDSDDPPMFGTDPTNDLAVLAAARGYDAGQLVAFTRNGIDGCWLDAAGKAELRRRGNAILAEIAPELSLI